MKRKLHILLAVGIGLTTSVGWLQATIVTPKDGAALLKDVAAANAGDTIKLAERHYVLDKQLVINKPIVLLGSTNEKGELASIISANPSAGWPKKPGTTELQNSTANLISIQGDESGTVTLENIKVTESLASGIHAQSKMTTVLKNVHSFKNSNAGLLVVSKVEATGLETFGNGWGGVNVDKGSPAYDINFKFDGASRFHEPYQIWTEQTTTENLVTSPERYKWETYTIQGSGTEKAKKYWVQSELNMDYVAQFPRNDKLKAGYTFVYAGGASINIQQSSNDGFITINSEGKTLLELPEKCNPVIFGGSKEALDGNTNITMESGRVYALFGGGYNASVKDVALTVNGGTVKQYLVGGGFGPNSSKDNAKSADATAVTMNVKGASVGYLISGGMEFSKVTSTDVAVENATVNYALGGGFAPANLGQTETTDSKDYFNSVGTSNFLMTGGTVTLASCAGGGYSYSAMGTANAIYNNVTFNGGLYGAGWRGYTTSSTVIANGCTFNYRAGDYRTIAAMVRGKAKNISMTFDDKCVFDAKYECYLGTDRDSEQKDPIPTSDNITITFQGTSTPIVNVSHGMQNVTVTGAKVNVAPFLWKASTPDDLIKDFTIPANKTWTFNDGLTMVSGVTLTKTGTLEYKKSFDANVATIAEMQNAMGMIKEANADPYTVNIKLEKDLVFDTNTTYMGGSKGYAQSSDWSGIFYVGSARMNKLTLIIDGNNKSISGKKYTDDSANSGSKNYLFYIEGSDITSATIINNLSMKDLDIVGFNLYNLNGITFNNVDMTGNKQGAIHLNSSKLTANKLTTSGNKKFAIKLSRQVANLPGVVLNDGCKLAETDVTQIGYYDRAAYNLDKDITIPATTDIIKMVSGSYGNTLARSWAKATLHTDKNDALARVWTSNLTTLNINNSGGAVKLDPNATGLDLLLIDTGFANVEGVMNTGVKSETFNKEFTASALNSGLIINCEDAYLVTGKDEAQDFAEIAKNKPVYQLALADKKLAVVSAFGTPTIDGIESWNDTKFAKQNVIITKNGNLTINVAMALDTIFMEEGAQLKVLANTAVTANAVQLKYKVTNNWKPLGFPYEMAVKDAAGTTVEAKAGVFGNTTEKGLWVATVKATEVDFEAKAGVIPTANLIASDKRDSLIYVTSSAVTDVKTVAAPATPAVKTTTPSLAMKANPNLHPTQVMGNVYIYDATENVFTQQFNPEVAPFQSYIVADAATTSTLRSLRVGDAPTGNEEITPVEGYYVEAGHGMITIRTAEPVQVIVADMLGRIVYNARVTTDGQQINLPAGIYAVNKQKVIVK